MMARRFDFLFDVGGPNGYLVHRVLPAFCAETGAEAVYVPVLLGGLFKATGNRPPIMRYADSPPKMAYEMLELRRFVAAHGLTKFTMNPHFPLNTLLVMRGAVAAGRQGVMPAYVEAMMAAMWEAGEKIDDPVVCIAVLDAAGLDGAGLIAAADDPDVKAELAANTDRAVARGAFGIPTFFVGDEMFWGKERLAQVQGALTARTALAV